MFELLLLTYARREHERFIAKIILGSLLIGMAAGYLIWSAL